MIPPHHPDLPENELGYTLEVLAEATGVSVQTILLYREHGIIPAQSDDDTVRLLRRVEHLREHCGLNLHGLKLVTQLFEEIELLRAELRARR